MEAHLHSINDFKHAIKRIHLATPDLLDESLIAQGMGIGMSTFRTWKSRGTVQSSALIRFCLTYKVNLNWFFYGKGDLTLSDDRYSLPIPKDLYKDMREAIKLVSMEMNRLNLSFEDETLDALIQTYFKYNNKTNVDINMVVRAVAETFIPLEL